MDLLVFMKRAGFKADVRDIIKLMKWNVSLKEKLASKIGDDIVVMTIEEVVELFESIILMMHKISVGVKNKRQIEIVAESPQPKNTMRLQENNINQVVVCDEDKIKADTIDDEEKLKIVVDKNDIDNDKTDIDKIDIDKNSIDNDIVHEWIDDDLDNLENFSFKR
ncbi:unknown [Cryptophlebia leucotreta granulovirus]|uniref:Uncharacterized protein n=1 Tax=Cryptophlebia leucotreta granulosis virus TaxID=35254 RepID=Q7T5T4_GVCL|nr:hypothetical protein [Cryptophlebia leucotreta granulovirus]AAQ21600.1 unknown [Cryptophlebia leucotreta granulovirus]